MAGDKALDWSLSDSTLVLLDTSRSSTTKLWRFSPSSRSYVQLDTSTAQLDGSIAGMAVDVRTHSIYLSNSVQRTVQRISAVGELDASFVSWPGLVEPAGLFVRHEQQDIFVADSAYSGMGAVMQLSCVTGHMLQVIVGTSPVMYRPLSVTIDLVNNQAYAADSNGYVFQFDLNGTDIQESTHLPVPTASNIVSMTVSANGNVYMLDAYSRRLIILAWQLTGWDVGDPCIAPLPPSWSSSSSSSSTPSHGPTQSSTLAWSSSSSTSSAYSAPSTGWSTVVLASLAVVGAVAVAGGAICLYQQRRSRHGMAGMDRESMHEQLISEAEERKEEAGGDKGSPTGSVASEEMTQEAVPNAE